MIRTRIKICGLTREQDVSMAVAEGADALGFVFAPRSQRRLEPEQATALVERVPAFVDRVGLFQDQDAESVARVLDQVPLNLLQFHGSETCAFCGQFGLPYIKAVSMAEDDAISRAGTDYPDAAGLVLDSHALGQPGGTGKLFDWHRIGTSGLPLIVAGGLTPDNVFGLVRQFGPWAVDVSSGVESAPGIKDAQKVSKFIAEVERGNQPETC